MKSFSRIVVGVALCTLVPVAGLVSPVGAQESPAGEAVEAVAPTTEDVLLALRDVGMSLEGVQVRSALASEAGRGTALVQLPDTSLVDVQLRQAAEGWSVRDLFLVAGDPGVFTDWTSPWRRRVEAARSFVAAAQEVDDELIQRPEELAPLIWFEDPAESSRLWGLNPTTYRMMQALRMVPSGPMGGATPGNPMPRRPDQ